MITTREIGIVSPSFATRLSRRRSRPTPVHGTGGGFDLYERGVDAVHSATREWRRSPKSPTPRARRIHPLSPRAYRERRRLPRLGESVEPSAVDPKVDGSNPRRSEPETTRKPRTWRAFAARGRTPGAANLGCRGRIRSRPGPIIQAQARVGGRRWSSWWGRGTSRVRIRPGSSARRLFDPDAKARAERAVAVAAAAERKAVERMEAARSRRKGTTSGRSGGAAWQPVKRDDRSASANSANRRASSFGGGVLAPETDRRYPRTRRRFNVAGIT